MKTTWDDFFNSFHIGAYYLQKNARTEEHIKDLKDCGIDLLFGMDHDLKTLDLLWKYGIDAVVSGVVPGWFGGNGSNAGTMRETNKIETYRERIGALEEHPAVKGIDVGDEPSALDLPYYGEVIALIGRSVPNLFPYLNLYPSYGMLATNEKEQIRKELGTTTYEEYLEQYTNHVDLPYLSFDHYLYSSDESRFFGDLFAAASRCKKSQKRLWVVLQVNSREKDVFLSEENLCFQGFAALAYGASAISWACYSAGWWYNHVLDSEGNKTQQYGKLKKVNGKLRHLTAESLQYRWVDTQMLKGGESASFEEISSIRSSQDALLGKFKNENGKRGIFLFPLKDGKACGSLLRFRLDRNRKARLYKPEEESGLIPEKNGEYRVDLRKNEACFITFD